MMIEQLLSSSVSGREDPAAPAASPWAAAARKAAEERTAPAEDPALAQEPSATRGERLVLVGAHGGAGATSWAHILGGRDAGLDLGAAAGAAVMLVARESAVGIAAAKAALADHVDQVAAVLIVPAAPGKPHRMLQGEVRVLRGAVPVVRAPWVPGLLIKPPEAATVDDVREKDLTRLTDQLETILEGDK